MNDAKEFAQLEHWKQLALFNMKLVDNWQTEDNKEMVRFVLECKLTNKLGEVYKAWKVDLLVGKLSKAVLEQQAARAFATALHRTKHTYKKIEPMFREESEGVDNPINPVLVV